MSEKRSYLNLGCGGRYHPEWINIDIVERGPGVIRHDVSRGIPLRDGSCDVVYHAAVLEHLRRPDAAALMAECSRVLKPGGIVRVGVPDLEAICRLYLARLASAVAGGTAAAHDYDWMMLELFDQVARERSGGGMLDYLRQEPLPNEAFVLERIGVEGEEMLSAFCGHGRPCGITPAAPMRRVLRGVRTLPERLKGLAARVLLGAEDRRALAIGRFRLSGEAHQWMYDRFSLARLLVGNGFGEVRICDALTSSVPEWARFHLDALPDGRVLKPDLMFMEAVKRRGGAHRER